MGQLQDRNYLLMKAIKIYKLTELAVDQKAKKAYIMQ